MENWHEWRKQGLGASDAPVIMGISPYKTRYQLWEEKTGLADHSAGNWATKRGNEMEPRARADYEMRNNIEMPVAFVEHKDYPFIRASLDGYNEHESIILEIKCPGKEDHQTAVDGKVPVKYWPQVQHQLLVTGANELHYYSFSDDRGVIVVVRADVDYCTKLVAELSSFWNLVTAKTPPELSDADFKKVADKDLKELISKWKRSKSEADLAKDIEDNFRTSILEKLGSHPRWLCDDVRIFRTSKIGSVDYSKIPELNSVDLNQYRKKPSVFWNMKVKNANN